MDGLEPNIIEIIGHLSELFLASAQQDLVENCEALQIGLKTSSKKATLQSE